MDEEPPQSQIASSVTAATTAATTAADGEDAVNSQRALRSGYLIKRSPKRKNWRRRWFVLRPRQLCHYKSDKEYELLRIVPLDSVRSVTATSFKKHRHANTLAIVTRAIKPTLPDSGHGAVASAHPDGPGDPSTAAVTATLAAATLDGAQTGSSRTVTTFYIDCLTRPELCAWARALEDAIRQLPNKQVLRWVGSGDSNSSSNYDDAIGFVVLDGQDAVDARNWSKQQQQQRAIQVPVDLPPADELDQVADEAAEDEEEADEEEAEDVGGMSSGDGFDESSEEEEDDDEAAAPRFPPPAVFAAIVLPAKGVAGGSGTSEALSTALSSAPTSPFPHVTPTPPQQPSRSLPPAAPSSPALSATLCGYLFKKSRGLHRSFPGAAHRSTSTVQMPSADSSAASSPSATHRPNQTASLPMAATASSSTAFPLYFTARQCLWRARWCTLRGNVLAWYEDEDEYEALRAININDVIDIVAEPPQTVKLSATKTSTTLTSAASPASRPGSAATAGKTGSTRGGVLGLMRRGNNKKFDGGLASAALPPLNTAAAMTMMTANRSPVVLPLDPAVKKLGDSPLAVDCQCPWCAYGRAWAASLAAVTTPCCAESSSHCCYLSHPPPPAVASLTTYWTIVQLYHVQLVAWHAVAAEQSPELVKPDPVTGFPPVPDFFPLPPQFAASLNVADQQLPPQSAAWNSPTVTVDPTMRQPAPSSPSQHPHHQQQQQQQQTFQLFPIQVVTQGRNFCFAATSQAEFQQWLGALRMLLYTSRCES